MTIRYGDQFCIKRDLWVKLKENRVRQISEDIQLNVLETEANHHIRVKEILRSYNVATGTISRILRKQIPLHTKSI